MSKLIFAIQYLHSNHIMHRDIKLDNILLLSNNEQEPIIADFGLSTFDNQPITDILFKRCGTPGFVAPEILNFQENNANVMYSNKCDIFSLGIIFYCLIVRKKPFNGKVLREIIKQNKECYINFEIPEIISTPESAQNLLKQMLEIDPTKRFSAFQCLKSTFFQENFRNNNDILINYDIANLKQQKIELDAIFAIKLKNVLDPVRMSETEKNNVENIEKHTTISENTKNQKKLNQINLEEQENQWKLAQNIYKEHNQQMNRENIDSQESIIKRQETVLNGKLDTVESMAQDISPNIKLFKQLNQDFSQLFPIIQQNQQNFEGESKAVQQKSDWGTRSTDLYAGKEAIQKEKNFLFDLIEVKSNELVDQENN